jgi:MFS family permease
MTSAAATASAVTSRRAAERSRALRTLFAGVGLGSTGYIAAATVSAIVATELAGTSTLAGIPAATVVLGSAFGSAWLSSLMARRGRRPGLITGYAVGTVGALVALVAVFAHSFPVFLAGTALLGISNSANQLSRYAAADMVPGARRASTLSTVVWAGTIGGVLGPNLGQLAWQPEEATGSGASTTPTGQHVVAATTPAGPADREASSLPAYPNASVRQLLQRTNVRAAVLALVAGQVVMTLIMTMTAVHMTEHGHDIAAVGVVISGHVFGMFALSPVSGRLTDRLGPMRVILAGLSLSAISAVIGAAAPADGGPQLFLALFLLGYGWNLGFVAGSSLLSSGLASAERTRIQGVADALIWCSAAAASLGSGVVQSVAGFTALCLLGVALAVGPALVLLARRRQLSGASEGAAA